jgi:protein TonB
MLNTFNPKTRQFVAIATALLGSLVMIIMVVMLNRPVEKKDEVVVRKSRIIDVQKSQQTQVAQVKPEPKSEPKPQQSSSLMPNFGSMLGGIAMNIPEFSFGNIMGDAAAMMDEITDDKVMNDNTVDEKPKVVSRTPIDFPSSAAGTKGYVVVNVLIAQDGSVEIAKVVESQPSGVFDDVAVNGVRNWRFSPAKYKGKPVKVWAKQKIKFD